MTDPSSISAQQIEFFEMLRSGKWQKPPAIRNLGIRPEDWLKEVRRGYVRYEWPNDGDRDIANGRVFGGWIAGFSDHIVSMCMASALDDGEWFTTTELQTRIFRPVPHGLITIEGRLVSRGRTTGFVEADWRDEKGRHLVRVNAAKAIRPSEEIGTKPPG
ncbi:MAG: PaaI family thioesterase [Pseudomonadota bacterium]